MNSKSQKTEKAHGILREYAAHEAYFICAIKTTIQIGMSDFVIVADCGLEGLAPYRRIISVNTRSNRVLSDYIAHCDGIEFEPVIH